MSGQARALATVAYELDLQSVSLISSNRKVVQIFLSEATALGIRVPRILELRQRSKDQAERVESFLQSHHNHQHHRDDRLAVALIVGPDEAVNIAEHLKHARKTPSSLLWLVGSQGLDLTRLSGWRGVFHGGVFVEPHLPELKDFKDYFISNLIRPGRRLAPSVMEYKEEMFGCTHKSRAAADDNFLVDCDEIPLNEIEMRFQQDPHVSYVVKAVSALAAAFRLAQLDHCSAEASQDCFDSVQNEEELHENILANLRKLSFSSRLNNNDDDEKVQEVEGTQHHFTRNGRLVANKQHLFTIDRRNGLEMVGWYSEDEGLHLRQALDQLVSNYPVSSPLIINDRSEFARSFVAGGGGSQNEIQPAETDNLDTSPIFSYESFISRTWALVVLSAAIFGFFVSLWMLLYVFQKMTDGTLIGGQSQTMGILLLIGTMILFVSVVPWLLPPNETICAVRHFMHPLSMALCFAILLVKSMQLRSLVSIGLGGTIPQVNQIVSLFFMVMVQAVIAVEWYLTSGPIGVQMTDGYPECSVSKARFLLLHIYPCVLLLLSFFYGVSVIKVKRNFNEGRWITCATIFIIPIFAAWPVVYYFAPVPFHDPSVAVSIVSVAGVILCTIFLPKMHTISHRTNLKQQFGHHHQAPPTDLSRSHSDATVYTGFSDYVPYVHHPAAPAAANPVMYPVYGYTTNYFIPPNANRKARPRNHQHKGANKVRKSNGANVKSYAEWRKDNNSPDQDYRAANFSTNNNNINRRKLGEDEPLSTAQVIYSVTRSDASDAVEKPPKISQPTTTTSTAVSNRRGRSSLSISPSPPRPLRRESASGDSKTSSTLHSLDINNRRMHSRSPTDGMILTASGLTDSSHEEGGDDGSGPGFTVSEVFLTH